MASSNTISFDEATPDVVNGTFAPPKPPSNFSPYYGCPPLGMRIRMRGLLVKGIYGDGRKQAELRETYQQQAETGEIKERLLSYSHPICDEQASAIKEWEESWMAQAAAHVKQTTVSKRGSKMAYSSLVREDGSFKINVPHDVAMGCVQEFDGSDVFDLGHGIYDLVFRISGIWRNSNSYGFSCTALRIKRVSTLSINKRKIPEDFETLDSKWEFKEASLEETGDTSE